MIPTVQSVECLYDESFPPTIVLRRVGCPRRGKSQRSERKVPPVVLCPTSTTSPFRHTRLRAALRSAHADPLCHLSGGGEGGRPVLPLPHCPTLAVLHTQVCRLAEAFALLHTRGLMFDDPEVPKSYIFNLLCPRDVEQVLQEDRSRVLNKDALQSTLFFAASEVMSICCPDKEPGVGQKKKGHPMSPSSFSVGQQAAAAFPPQLFLLLFLDAAHWRTLRLSSTALAAQKGRPQPIAASAFVHLHELWAANQSLLPPLQEGDDADPQAVLTWISALHRLHHALGQYLVVIRAEDRGPLRTKIDIARCCGALQEARRAINCRACTSVRKDSRRAALRALKRHELVEAISDVESGLKSMLRPRKLRDAQERSHLL